MEVCTAGGADFRPVAPPALDSTLSCAALQAFTDHVLALVRWPARAGVLLVPLTPDGECTVPRKGSQVVVQKTGTTRKAPKGHACSQEDPY